MDDICINSHFHVSPMHYVAELALQVSYLALARPKSFIRLQDLSTNLQFRVNIAHISKGLFPRHQTLLVYDTELLALVMEVNKWSQYLTSRSFLVKTDQQTLNFLLEKKLHIVVDALSRLPMMELAAMTLFMVKTGMLDLISQSWDDKHIRSHKENLRTRWGASGTGYRLAAMIEKGSEIQGYNFIHEHLRRNRKLKIMLLIFLINPTKSIPLFLVDWWTHI